MSESKHTPGPWRVIKSARLYDGAHDFAIGTDAAPVLAEAFGRDARGGFPPAEANARLIAAAPDLLDALILLEREMVLSGNAGSQDYGWKPAIEKTRAAIAKAEGRS